MRSPESGVEQLGKLSPLLLIFLTIFIDMVGFGIVIPVLPLYAQHFHASPWQIGLLFATFSFMQLFFAPLMGRWSDRIGRRPVILLSVIGTAVSFLILGFAKTLWMLFLGRMVDGVSGANISAAQAYIADITPPEKRSASMGILGAAFGLGFVFGPALGGLLGHYAIELPFFVAAGMALLNSIAIFFLLPESLPPEKRKSKLVKQPSLWVTIQEIRQTPVMVVMVCVLLSTTAFSLVTSLFTLFTQYRLHWGTKENGILFAGIGFMGVLIQGGLLRKLVPKTGEKPLVIIGCVLLALSMLILPLPFQANVILPVLIGSVFMACGNSLVTPLLSGLASKLSPEASQGSILGLLQSVSSFARMTGPAIGGVLLNQDAVFRFLPFGMTPFLFATCLMLAALYVATRLVSSTH